MSQTIISHLWLITIRYLLSLRLMMFRSITSCHHVSSIEEQYFLRQHLAPLSQKRKERKKESVCLTHSVTICQIVKLEFVILVSSKAAIAVAFTCCSQQGKFLLLKYLFLFSVAFADHEWNYPSNKFSSSPRRLRCCLSDASTNGFFELNFKDNLKLLMISKSNWVLFRFDNKLNHWEC